MDKRFLFLDANILLHYTFFVDIDWSEITNASSVELLLPYTVISTLDEKKYDSSDPTVRDRAKSVIAKLERITNREVSPNVRKNVTLCLLELEPKMDYATCGLNRDSEDDRLIAEILFFRETYPNTEFALVTGDLGLKLKCKRHDIPLVQLPDRYLLRERADAKTKRIKELEAIILELQSMQPKLQLAFPSGKDFTEFGIVPPQILSEDEIRRRVEDKRKDLAPQVTQHSRLHLIEQAAAKEYLDQYRSYLERENRYATYRSKIIKLEFVLINGGNATAEDTDVYIHFDGKFLIVSEDHVMPPPKEPKLPEKRRRDPLEHFRLPSIIPLAQQLAHPNISEPTVTKTTSGYKVHFHVQRIKQATPLALGNVYVVFDSIAEATSFGFKYTLNSHSLPHNVTGDLHIKIDHQ